MTVVYLRRLRPLDGMSPAEAKALRSDAVRRLLGDCLFERYDRSAFEWTLVKNEDGKPLLVSIEDTVDGTVPPHISLSHSGRWVMCALSDAPVGADVQEVRPISDAVVSRFAPEAAGGDERARTRAWTRYEACLKRYGSRAVMISEAEGQCYDCADLADAVATVCCERGAVEWKRY